jgi:hypothetical protein
MPSAALHSHYWAGSATAPAAPIVSGTASYPLWQTTITIGSWLGVFQVLYERWRPEQRTTTQVRSHGHP